MRRWLPLLLLGLALWAGACGGGSAKRNRKESKVMKLSLRLAREAVVHGESVPLHCDLTRDGGPPIALPMPEYNDLATRYVLEGGPGGPVMYNGATRSGLLGEGLLQRTETLEPASTIHHAWDVDLALMGHLPAPGAWKLHVEFSAAGEEARSPEVALRIEPARPEGDDFGWQITSTPRGSWEGVWLHRGAPGSRLMYQQAWYGDPELLQGGFAASDIGPGASEPRLAIRTLETTLTTWRWIFWLEGGQLRGTRADFTTQKPLPGSLAAALDGSHFHLLPRPLQDPSGAARVWVSAERDGQASLQRWDVAPDGKAREAHRYSLPRPVPAGHLFHPQLDREGKSSVWVQLETSAGHTRVLRAQDTPTRPALNWEVLADFPADALAWNVEDIASGRATLSLLVRDARGLHAGCFPLDAAGPWKLEHLRPFSGPPASAHSAAVATSEDPSIPLVLVEDAGGVWASDPQGSPALRRIALPEMRHGHQRLIPFASMNSRRFAGMVENEFGWRWIRLPRSARPE